MSGLNPFERKLLAEIALASEGCGTHAAREELRKAYESNALTDEIVRKAVPKAFNGILKIKEKAAREGWTPGVNEPVFMYFKQHNSALDKEIARLKAKREKSANPSEKKILGKAIKSAELCRLRVERKGRGRPLFFLMHGKGVVKKVPSERMGPLAILNPRKKKR
ncbi:MAG: hypothetical protein QXO69_00225 [archaeon]